MKLIYSRFVADCMLGSLARWLRILGYDTLYFRQAEDMFLIYVAKEDNRTLLTRDRELFKAAYNTGVCSVLLSSLKADAQLRELFERFSLKGRSASRCADCNGEIVAVSKEEVELLVPDFVYQSHRSFYKCKGCGKVYWQGSHRKNMINLLGFNPWDEKC